eukprot:SAG22_NODE_2589_length_2410_cov_1.832540_3_plen_59_part_00
MWPCLAIWPIAVWLQQVRYTIHWRWVKVDLFYLWVDEWAQAKRAEDKKVALAARKFLS